MSSGPASQADASELALAALRCFKPFLQDISIVYRVLDTLLTYLDKDSKWEKEMLAEVCSILNVLPRSPYPLLCLCCLTLAIGLSLTSHSPPPQTEPAGSHQARLRRPDLPALHVPHAPQQHTRTHSQAEDRHHTAGGAKGEPTN